MNETTINQRLKYLIDVLGLKVSAFSRELGVSETSTRNYTDRTTKPGADYLEKVANHFRQVNMSWLLTGNGEPLLPTSDAKGIVGTQAQNIYGNSIGLNLGTNTQMGPALNDLDLPTCKAQVAQLQLEVQNLREQLQRADALAASKDETISLLRASYRNPN
jgi:hypothetical protein